MTEPEKMLWHDMELVRISDVGKEFLSWLKGQTMPLVEDSDTPYDWAYYGDYYRFINNLPVVD